jgi:hypothetical protein
MDPKIHCGARGSKLKYYYFNMYRLVDRRCNEITIAISLDLYPFLAYILPGHILLLIQRVQEHMVKQGYIRGPSVPYGDLQYLTGTLCTLKGTSVLYGDLQYITGTFSTLRGPNVPYKELQFLSGTFST